MRIKGATAAAEAREWVKTPFRWQDSLKGPNGGCDCKGLIAGVARECGFPEAQSIYASMATYSPRKPVPCPLLFEGLSDVFDRIEFARGQLVPSEIEAGDVLLVRFRGRPQHLAIVTEPGADGLAVHAQIGPKDWVKETRLDVFLRAYQLHSIFRWRAE
jgi:cell wall-associated NlpC family hydrolase